MNNNYSDARDAAWKILLECKVDKLPVKMSSICLKKSIRMISYRRAASFLPDTLKECFEVTDGFTVNDAIFYDDENCTIKRQRFTIAHEIGHIILGHCRAKEYPESENNNIAEEKAANIFASRLLAPSCVLWGCNVRTADNVMELCDISRTAAEYRIDRMKQLYAREKEFRQRDNTSCFLMHPLERQVYKQFEEFINGHRYC